MYEAEWQHSAQTITCQDASRAAPSDATTIQLSALDLLPFCSLATLLRASLCDCFGELTERLKILLIILYFCQRRLCFLCLERPRTPLLNPEQFESNTLQTLIDRYKCAEDKNKNITKIGSNTPTVCFNESSYVSVNMSVHRTLTLNCDPKDATV